MAGLSLVEAPTLPTAYPGEERPHRVEPIETHVSYLFLASQILTGHYPHQEVLPRALLQVYTRLLAQPG